MQLVLVRGSEVVLFRPVEGAWLEEDMAGLMEKMNRWCGELEVC
jgi:hypothetical protein